ncbi:MAG: T9SS type A sorting domain-containing protein [Bacteroidetes bacterium]|nr:T9SS type A sorting domain-containing protein [Bacteroidota bacterium]
MKHRIIIWFFVAILALPGKGQDFYDINTIQTIEIYFTQSNWDFILDSLVAAGDEGRLLGNAVINGQQFDSVGVRYKGNSSYKPNQIKNPLNIKLDYVIEGQTLDGYGTIKLSNQFKDPSFVRETMGYEIARKYMPASKSNYANVLINGQHLGLYTNNQDVDKFFLTTHIGSGENTRIKGEMQGAGPVIGVWQYWGADSTQYFNSYQVESDFGWNKLVGFLDTLNNFNQQVEEVLYLDRHLWMLAYDNLLVNLDSPINMPQNYYIFTDDAGRFNPIVWDLNETFGGFNMIAAGPPLNIFQMQHLDPYFNVPNPNYPILNKILNDPKRRKMYIAHMKTMMEENFSNDWYLSRALEIQSIIDTDVQADPNKFYTYTDFINNVYTQVGGGPPPNMLIPGLVQLMDVRTDFLASGSIFLAQGPAIDTVTYLPSLVSPNTEVWFNATVTNADIVFLGHRTAFGFPFEKVQMFDDGNHHDGAAGDHVYGAMLIAGLTDIQYYIYAENVDAASFLPHRAEFEYFTVDVTQTLVINEFMADNTSTMPDQNGEYDDWIELYNNTSGFIDLSGFHLSDDPSDPGKWTFPDTVIAPQGYLIVWADNDVTQAGLHANFKLSATGESILLSDIQEGTLDFITYGPQKTDTTTGRYPNGTGDFILMWPTFSAENVNGFPTGIEQYDHLSTNLLLRLYPNPSSGVITVVLDLDGSGNIALKLADMSGRPVGTIYSGFHPGGEIRFDWNVSSYSPGTYIVSLSNTEKVLQTGMIIIR